MAGPAQPAVLAGILAFIGAALFALIAYRSTLETIATIDQFSNMLRWPHYPFRFTVAFGSPCSRSSCSSEACQSPCAADSRPRKP
jgi:hypothetical protein